MVQSLLRWWLVVALSAGAYAASLLYLQKVRYTTAAPELLVSMPRFAQILFFAGDRYLAANIGGFRVLVADTARMKAADYAVQARLQSDIAWFNPAHEDNYYIAANILPWGGQASVVAVTEEILRKAGAARPYDFLPYFHVGFIHYHFYRSPAEGAKWLLAAAEQTTDQQDKWSLQAVAAKWIERGYETAAAASLVDAMAGSAPAGGFRSYLQMRAGRLRLLAGLRAAALEFKSRHGRAPQGFEDLLRDGLIAELPKDPLGVGFVIGADGEPSFAGR
jgi:hypothetical protein